MAREKT